MLKIKNVVVLALGVFTVLGIATGVAVADPVVEDVDRSVVVLYETTTLNAEQLREIANLDNNFSGGAEIYKRELRDTPKKTISLTDSTPIKAPSLQKQQ